MLIDNYEKKENHVSTDNFNDLLKLILKDIENNIVIINNN
jgi:hypothetical protein